MVGSAIDGEDVVQEALAKAIEALPNAGVLQKPESWLFRIAHNAALDAVRRRKRQAAVQSAADVTTVEDRAADAGARVTVAGSFAVFLDLPVAQRASLILADVLGYDLAETAEILDISLAVLKANLHRGRARVRAPGDGTPAAVASITDHDKKRLQAYADLFNAREFDALRDLLAEHVRLDLVNRTHLAGRKDVSVYFTRYAQAQDWRFSVGLAEGRPALLVSGTRDEAIRYVVLLGWADARIATIRDFLYAPYAMEGMAIARL
jgi:RNA polymerase sigma-70 factor (ECF subfamily)